MEWHFVNAMTFESATHRVFHSGDYWLAERKAGAAIPRGRAEPARKIGGAFSSRADATAACEKDVYATASGR